MRNENLTFKDLRDRAYKTATHKGYDHAIADDFAQFACEKVHGGREAMLKHLLIDFLRQEFGSKRTTNQDKYLFHKNQESLNTETHDQAIEPPQLLMNFQQIADTIEDTQERTIFVLKFKWEMGNKEIGECLGVSESRVSQKTTETLARIKRSLNRHMVPAPLHANN